MLKNLLLLSFMLALTGCGFIERLAIPDARLISPALAQTGTKDSVSHIPWDDFLKRYTAIDSQGVVRLNYGSVSKEDQQALDEYLTTLSNTDPTRLTRDAQLAYWANLYNAKTVDVILEHYPVASIRDIKDGFFDLGPWEDKRLELQGRSFSLHDIEHGIVRPIWGDTPEIHYILNCAAVGCPNLPRRAYTANNVQDLMQKAAIAYVNDAERGVHIDANGRVSASKIYSWYRDDFGGSDASILSHLRTYAAPELKSRLNESQSIGKYRYDWLLNDEKL